MVATWLARPIFFHVIDQWFYTQALVLATDGLGLGINLGPGPVLVIGLSFSVGPGFDLGLGDLSFSSHLDPHCCFTNEPV